MLHFAPESTGNVSKACQIMGLSRDTFYRYRDAVEDGGVEALDLSRKSAGYLSHLRSYPFERERAFSA